MDCLTSSKQGQIIHRSEVESKESFNHAAALFYLVKSSIKYFCFSYKYVEKNDNVREAAKKGMITKLKISGVKANNHI